MTSQRSAEELPAPFDPDALPRVLSRATALDLGYSRHSIDRRLRSGQWRRILPHTYLTADTLTWLDRANAALALCGEQALLSGAAALRISGLRKVREPTRVLVLVPESNRARSASWVEVRRTRRMPEPEFWYGPRRAVVSRALADHALTLTRIDDVRAVVTDALRGGLCSVDELIVELDTGARRGSAHLRRTLTEVAAGAGSAPEARAAHVLRRGGVTGFQQNVRIDLPGGHYYVADFLWPQLKAVLEIDSVEHHFAPADWRATMDRHLALSTLGYSVVHRPPSAVLREPVRFARDIAAWLAQLTRQAGL